MNAVEIEEAISALAEQPFDAEEFPFAFLLAFGNKETTIKRLRSGASNKSDVGGERWLRFFGQRPAGFKWIPAGVVERGAWRFCRGVGRA